MLLETGYLKAESSILTLQADSVPLQTLHSLLEESFAGRRHSRNIVLLPLDGRVDVLKDLLDGLGDFMSNTISGNEGDLSG